MNAPAEMCHSSMRPVTTNTPRPKYTTANVKLVVANITRRLTRSAMVPINVPSNSNGANRKKPMNPTANAESASW